MYCKWDKILRHYNFRIFWNILIILLLKVLNDKIIRILQNKYPNNNILQLYFTYNTLPIQMLHIQQILIFVVYVTFLKS